MGTTETDARDRAWAEVCEDERLDPFGHGWATGVEYGRADERARMAAQLPREDADCPETKS